MGVRITPVTESFLVGEDLTWLTHGYEDALETADSITLDSTSCAALFPASGTSPLVVIPSGTLLAKITATGKWGPYDATTPATDGRQLTANASTGGAQIGYLAKTTQLNASPNGAGGLVDVGAPLLWQGEVSIAKLAASTGKSSGIGVADSAARTALRQIRFVS